MLLSLVMKWFALHTAGTDGVTSNSQEDAGGGRCQATNLLEMGPEARFSTGGGVQKISSAVPQGVRVFGHPR